MSVQTRQRTTCFNLALIFYSNNTLTLSPRLFIARYRFITQILNHRVLTGVQNRRQISASTATEVSRFVERFVFVSSVAIIAEISLTNRS